MLDKIISWDNVFDYSKIPMCLLFFPRILLECLCLASKEIDHVFVLEVSILSYIVLMYFGTIPTVFYHLFCLYYHFKNSVQLIGLVQKNASKLFHQVLFSNDIATKLLTFMKQYVSYFLPMINGSNHSCMEYWINWLVQY